MINSEVKKYIEQSVLYWLATVDEENQPNVSPKEMFAWLNENTILIANIASPKSVENIKHNSKVCVSFVDVFVQKGYKLKGRAAIIQKDEDGYREKKKHLTELFSDEFPIRSIMEIKVKSAEPIIAPSYFLFTDVTEEDQIESAMQTYNVESRNDSSVMRD